MSVQVVRDDCFDWYDDNRCPNRGTIDLVITDPPYGKIVDEGWDRAWSIDDQRELGFMIEELLKPGGTAYVWGGVGTYQNRVFFEWLANLENEHNSLRIWDVVTWAKRRFYGVQNRYGFAREECAVLVNGDKPATFHVPYLDVERGYDGFNKKYPAKSKFKRRTNVWTDVTEIFRGKIHPCEKPSRLAEIMIETSSNPGELVVDMFAGAGGVGVACQKLNRECILVEKSDCPMRI